MFEVICRSVIESVFVVGTPWDGAGTIWGPDRGSAQAGTVGGPVPASLRILPPVRAQIGPQVFSAS